MRTKNAVVLLTLAFFVSTSAYAQSQWLTLAQARDKSITWQAKDGSLSLTFNQNDEPIVLIDGQVLFNSEKIAERYIWYVRTRDCRAGKGKFVVLNQKGAFQFERDFVRGGEDIGSKLANALCALEEMASSANGGKGVYR